MYWDAVAPDPQSFDFSSVDALLGTVAAYNKSAGRRPAKVMLVAGARNLRFPEVHIPAWAPETLSVNPYSPAKTLAELLVAAKSKPINYGSPGVGTSGHIVGAYLFKELAKVEAVHVPFQGGAPAVNALLGGHVDAITGAVTGYAGQLKAGSIRGIAVAAEQRLPQLPDIPTYAEGGFPGIIASTWVGIFAPARTDKAILDKLNGAVNDVVRDPATQAQFQAMQTEFRIGDRADASAFFRHDVARWRKMITSIGLVQ